MTGTRITTRELGRTGMQITPIGFGAWAVGGGNWEFGWGPQEDEQSIAAIQHALELGLNWIDTAAAYGFGHSEEVVGRALQGVADRPYVFTKASLVEGPGGKVLHDLSRDSIRREAEASLGRLGIEAIDLYQIHWPIPDQDIEQGWAALAELRDEGLVRHIGVSNFDVEQMRRVQGIAPIETLQPEYSLIAREVEESILPFAEGQGIGVIAYSPMGSGLLTGKMTRERIQGLPENDWRREDARFTEPRLGQNLALAEAAKRLGERHGVSPGAVAIAWTLRNPAVDGAIVGLRRPEQLDELIAGATLELGAGELEQAERELQVA